MNQFAKEGSVLIDLKDSLKRPFSRGFLFSDFLNEEIKDWTTLEINGFYLHYDPLCQVVVQKCEGSFLILLGTAINLKKNGSDLQSISMDLFAHINNKEDDLYEYLDSLNGRFALIYKKIHDQRVKVLNDACGIRSVPLFWKC